MKQDLYFKMNHEKVNVDWMKVYTIRSKNGL